MSATLYVTRGLPGSGKTYWARRMCLNPRHLRANRDDLRASLYGRDGVLSYEEEENISYVQRTIVRRALQDGYSVVVDDTNLRVKYVKIWEQMAAEEGAKFVVMDFFDVPLDLCIARDKNRLRNGERYVGADVIGRLHAKWFPNGVAPKPYLKTAPEVLTIKKYEGTPGMPQAVIVDLDGTCTIRVPGENGQTRSPFDWARVGEDAPYEAVVNLVKILQEHYAIVFLSGRDAVCQEQTRQWLTKHGLSGELYMRKQNDNRKDSIVKEELFNTYVAPFFDVQFVLDDRNQVVEQWRKMGLPCFQVAEGNF